ncbi:MAG TPA: four helix bundle protein [Allomuricauda sp.]|nr:four helix bundle protein [Allomuricauda sp.]
MATIEKFEDLEVWQLARTICQKIEQLFQRTSLGKNFSLKDQMERSSGSIMDNIAEGFGRDGNREFHNFLSYAKGSCTELKSQLYRAFDKELIHKDQMESVQEIIETEINKIGAFMFYLRKSEFKGQKFKSEQRNNKQ